MNPDIKKRWVEALRSGRYQKGHYKLRDSKDCYCALGVLCDIIDPTLWKRDPQWKDRWQWNGRLGGLNEVDADPVGLSINRQLDVGFMNDEMDMSGKRDTPLHDFNAIADYIEEHV